MRHIYTTYEKTLTFGLFILTLLLGGVSFGQITTTVATGTSTSSELPIYGNYGYNYSQQIYLATDFDVAVQGQPSSISKIRFFYVSGSLVSSTSWNITMGQTSQVDFPSTTSWIPSASLTPVFSGNVTAPAGDSWLEITLSTPFLWDGVSNIVVAIDENTPSYSNVIWRRHSTGANRSILYYNDWTNPNPSSPPTANARYSYVAQAQFVHEPVTSCSGTPSHTTISASNTTICENSDVDLVLNGTDFEANLEYTWQYDNGTGWQDFSNTTSTLNFTSTITETIDVRAVTTCLNSGDTDISDVITINSASLPTVLVDVTETTYCSGSSVVINASGANTYSWSPSTGLNTTTGTTVNANPSANTTYTVTGTDANGCINTATSAISPVESVEVSASYSPLSNCTAGNPVTITTDITPSTTTGGNWEYKFLGTDGVTILQDWNTTNTYNFIPSTDSVYNIYYQVRNSGCSDYIDSTLIIVTIGFGADVNITDYNCNNLGGIIELSDIFGQTEETIIYNNLFSNTSSTTELTFNGVASINNNRAEITPSQTSTSGSMKIDIPGFTAGVNNSMVVSFKLTADQPINNWGTGGGDGLSYSFGDDALTSSPGPLQNGKGTKLRLVFDAAGNSPNVAGIYLVYGYTGTDAIAPGSTGTLAYSPNLSSWKLLQDIPVVMSIDASGFVNVTVGGNQIFSNVQLPASYLTEDVSNWNHLFGALTGGDALRHAVSDFEIKVSSLKYSLTQTTVAPSYVDLSTFTNLQPGSYDLWISQDASGTCSKMIGTYEIVNTNPLVNLGNDTTICEGEVLTLDAGYPGASYVWSNSNNTAQTMNVNETGTYVAYVTNPNSCIGIGTIDVTVIDAPSANGIYVQGTFPNIIFTVENPTNVDSYSWDFGDNSTANNAPATVTHSYWAEGNYDVTVTLTNDCGTETITQNVSVQSTASINENEIEGVSVYPNPATDIVTVKLPESMIAKTTIYSVDGSIVYDAQNFTGTTEINVQEWTKGVYFIYLSTENKNTVIKLMVK